MMMNEHVKEHGFTITAPQQGPERDQNNDPIMTLGLVGMGLPELMIFGVDIPLGTTILAALAKLQIEQGPLTHERRITSELFKDDADITLLCLEVLPENMWMLELDKMLFPDKEPTAIQVVWPDKNRLFPWEFGSQSGHQFIAGRKPSEA